MKVFDLNKRAENGLRRGLTTGTSAAAAVKAAVRDRLGAPVGQSVCVSLPSGEECVYVPIASVVRLDAGTTRVEVIKEAGDDPDQTQHARIYSSVRRNQGQGIRFLQGEGVGKVTQRGLSVSVGEPAINPIPRRMIREAIREVLMELGASESEDWDVEIGCYNGAAIAAKTFNPRLGIEGGISILGTTGIVEPKSQASFRASIEIYISVAVADRPSAIVMAPGNLGQRFARSMLELPTKQIVQMSNFVGFAFDRLEKTLEVEEHRLERLWVVGHPGKLLKLLDGYWDTHSERGGNAVTTLAWHLHQSGWDREVVDAVRAERTVEAGRAHIGRQPDAIAFWEDVQHRLEMVIRDRMDRITHVDVRLFRLDGQSLTGGEVV